MGKEEERSDQTKPGDHKPRQLTMTDIYGQGGKGVTPQPLGGSERNHATNTTKKGKLKIFLGAAAGVGKTYAMLEEAQGLQAQGIDVVAGYIELHGRKETERLLAGLAVIPFKEVEYRSAILTEMDVEAIILRHPEIVLVDELAHTNAPGQAFAKRYEDVEELLESGINVYTTVNVQHLESLNDRVFELTGTRVRETFPDRLLDLADEVVLIDLPPQDLRERIRQGKVYRPEKVEQALQNFFTTNNLVVLRELALRETADTIGTNAASHANRYTGDEEAPTANPFILICVALKPADAHVIRQGWRFSRRLKAPVEVINVSSDDERLIDQEQTIVPLRLLARTLDIPFRELKGDPVEQIVTEARAKRATLIVLGESIRTTWQERLFGSFTDRILRRLVGIDVYIVGDPTRRINK